jgi:hypothetical protein
MLTNFKAYAVDCTIEAQFDLTADRLREQLNDQDQVVLLRAVLTRLVDGSQICIPRLVLDTDELYAVEAGPSRVAEARRLHTVQHRRRARMGPYAVLGHLHERPGVAPLGSLRITRPFVPFTDCRIAYQLGARMESREMDTLLVNGRTIAWLGEANATDEPSAGRLPAGVLIDAI